MSGRSLALRRINKDMKEINQNPVEGIGIASLDNDPMKYVVNIKLMNGPYKDYCVQLLLTFPETYPSKPPKILIYPDQAIDGQYHHHIFGDSSTDENGHYFKKFCFDLLDNDFMSTKEENTGWNPSYTISSLLLQVQNFISDPDMHGYIPDKHLIGQLFNSMKHYSRNFTIVNDEGKTEVIKHTWENPFPKMFEKEQDKKENKNEIKDEISEKEKLRMQQIKDNLTCFMLKLNYIDDPEILLGYPIIKNICYGKKEKMELYPIPELLTYDGYMAQIGKQDDKLDFYFDIKFKSANNQFYNYWVPIYIDENHYKKNRTAILNSFSIIKYGARGIEEYDFKPEQIFQILPNLLNKMIIGMFTGKTNICSSFIRCYFQYVLLFKKLCLEYEKEYLEYVNHILNVVKNNAYNADKSIIPDIGDFFMLLFFSNKDTQTEKMKKIWTTLFEEFAVRQAYWIFHEDSNKEKMLNIMKEMFWDDFLFQHFEKTTKYESIDNKALFEDLKGKKLLDTIVEIIMSDPHFTSLEDENYLNEKQVINGIEKSFKKIYLLCNQKTRETLKKYIIKKLDIENYFYTKDLYDIEDEFDGKRRETIIYENYYFEQCKVDELLIKLDKKTLKQVLDYAFESQRGNKLLIITFFTRNKIEDKQFMQELEKNYGIYLEVDKFIKDMNQQIKDIKNYNQFFNYIGSDFGKNMTDLDILIHCYKKAREKKYIKNYRNNHNANSQSHINIGLSFRGRGGLFRGRGELFRGRGHFRGRGGRGIP
jgi:ubiquitin-protein ligase